MHAIAVDLEPRLALLFLSVDIRGDMDHVALLRGVRNLAPAVCAAGPGWRHARLPKPVRYVTTLPAAVTAVQAFLAAGSDGRRTG